MYVSSSQAGHSIDSSSIFRVNTQENTCLLREEIWQARFRSSTVLLRRPRGDRSSIVSLRCCISLAPVGELAVTAHGDTYGHAFLERGSSSSIESVHAVGTIYTVGQPAIGHDSRLGACDCRVKTNEDRQGQAQSVRKKQKVKLRRGLKEILNLQYLARMARASTCCGGGNAEGTLDRHILVVQASVAPKRPQTLGDKGPQLRLAQSEEARIRWSSFDAAAQKMNARPGFSGRK